ncbi:hypothetical protein SDC9_188446 [bioreactor metagenome]|uniref:Uncharacterized protein n=1 Tax=bioreactor metagenome TaxID=1076179 RepID=A0A645HQS0_9ZZZZ
MGCGNSLEFFPQGLIEHIGHVRKARAEFFQIGAHKGVVQGKLNIIPDKHQLAARKIQVHAAGCIGNDEGFNSQQAGHPHRIGNLLHGMAFINMEAALHHEDAFTAQKPGHEPARMAHRRTFFKMGDLPIGNVDGGLHLLGQAAQAAAQDE